MPSSPKADTYVGYELCVGEIWCALTIYWLCGSGWPSFQSLSHLGWFLHTETRSYTYTTSKSHLIKDRMWGCMRRARCCRSPQVELMKWHEECFSSSAYQSRAESLSHVLYVCRPIQGYWLLWIPMGGAKEIQAPLVGWPRRLTALKFLKRCTNTKSSFQLTPNKEHRAGWIHRQELEDISRWKGTHTYALSLA